MKIDGVLGGKSKGLAKQLTPKRKAEATVKDAAAKHGDEENDGAFLCFASEIVVNDNIHISPAGSLLRGKYANNHYRAKGTCMLHFRERSPDRVRAPKKVEFSISFKDCLDDIGLPDTKLTEYDFKLL